MSVENEGIECQIVDDLLIGEGGLRKQKKTNQRKINSTSRIAGNSYISRKGVLVGNKFVQPNPCKSMKCQNKCGNIDETTRQRIFDSYYALDNQQQKNFLVTSVKTDAVKRKYTNNCMSRRSCTKFYFLPVEGEIRKVCQQFFLKTLNISQTHLRYTDLHQTNIFTAKTEGRGKKYPVNKTEVVVNKAVEDFIKKLPAVPSHYTRSSTSKKYLPLEHKNISAVYRAYKTECVTESPQRVYVKEKIFREIFTKKFNIGFHLPKKDKCNICEKIKNTPDESLSEVEKEKFEKHKSDAALSKDVHLISQERSKNDPSFICTSFDVQKVLSTPHGNSILLFYSRKYAMYNETFYESGTKNGYSFVWGEENGNRGANEICTILLKYLSIVESRKIIETVSLFCDSCPGQNKNNQILAAILWFMMNKANNIKFLSITYLQPGHTYMPVDSMHATIESNLKKKIIWAPSEWPTVISNARFKPKPYEVFTLKHEDFMDYKTLQINIFPKLSKADDGTKIKINDIKRVSFTKQSSVITIQNSFDPDSDKKEVTVNKPKQRRGSNSSVLQPAYKKKLSISIQKYNDLAKLCKDGVIPLRYHREFLEMSGRTNVNDTLGETDEEDREIDTSESIEV